MYDNEHDANLYLTESIIRFQHDPVYITVARYKGDGKISLGFMRLLDGEKNEALITDVRFNFSPVPLGYAQDSLGRITYVARQPSRTWKQGLSDKNILNYGHDGRVKVRNLPDWKPLHNCIMGKVKSLDKAIEEGGIVSRDLFIKGNRDLYFKGKKIGTMRGAKPILLNEYSFMDKYLEEVFGK